MLVSLVLSARTKQKQNKLQSVHMRVPNLDSFGRTGPASVCVTIRASAQLALKILADVRLRRLFSRNERWLSGFDLERPNGERKLCRKKLGSKKNKGKQP